MMEQGLIDILNKAKKVKRVHGELNPFMISCMTLIAILETLEAADAELAAQTDALEAVRDFMLQVVPPVKNDDLLQKYIRVTQALAALPAQTAGGQE